jgi:hypothetical protein
LYGNNTNPSIHTKCIEFNYFPLLSKFKMSGTKTEVYFAHRILVFHIFSHFFGSWVHFQCDLFNINVKFLIFLKKFYKVHSFKVLSQDPINKKNFTSLIITNMELRLEPCVFNLIWKYSAKDLKKRKPSNFH